MGYLEALLSRRGAILEASSAVSRRRKLEKACTRPRRPGRGPRQRMGVPGPLGAPRDGPRQPRNGTRSSREWRKIRSSQSTGTARTHSDLRMASLRWTSQKHTNVATVSPFAAPSGTARPQSDLGVASLRWASRSPRNWRQLRISQPPGTARPHADMRMAPLRWTNHGPTNVATVSQFAANRDGEVSF